MMKEENNNATSNNRHKQDENSLVTEKLDKRGVHPNSQANLQPFEKGESGNPLGRPQKYENLKKQIIAYGKKQPVADWDFEVLVSEPTYREEAIRQLWLQAKKGSLAHIKYLAELGCLDDDK